MWFSNRATERNDSSNVGKLQPVGIILGWRIGDHVKLLGKCSCMVFAACAPTYSHPAATERRVPSDERLRRRRFVAVWPPSSGVSALGVSASTSGTTTTGCTSDVLATDRIEVRAFNDSGSSITGWDSFGGCVRGGEGGGAGGDKGRIGGSPAGCAWDVASGVGGGTGAPVFGGAVASDGSGYLAPVGGDGGGGGGTFSFAARSCSSALASGGIRESRISCNAATPLDKSTRRSPRSDRLFLHSIAYN